MPGDIPTKGRACPGQRLRHAERVAQGLCTRCGKLPPEPGLKVCRSCGGKRRAAERARRARARAQGNIYVGRDPDLRRRADRAGDRRRRRTRQDAGLCTSCGHHPPADGRSVCEPCRQAQCATERARYAARRAAGICVRCAHPAIGGSSRCGRCAAFEAERASPGRRSAINRKRYARRRAQGVCVDCGVHAGGAARCPRCAYRSNARAPERHLVSLRPPQIAVIELETGDELGVWETEAEAAACLVFAGLRPDQVEIRSNVPLMALSPHHEPASPQASRRRGRSAC